MSTTLAETTAHLRGLEREQQRQAEARRAVLADSLPRAVALLRSIPGVTQIVLFGSLAEGGVHAWSDLDLAVEGLPRERYFSVLTELMLLVPGGVDLVRLEEAPPSLAARIHETGRPL